MVLVLFGDSCVGKSSLAAQLKNAHQVELYSGKDYLRLAKTQSEAEPRFTQLLAESDTAGDPSIVYVITEPQHLALLPANAFRVLVTAPLDTIQQRFAARTGGTLPPPVAAMLERKYNAFAGQPCHLTLDTPSPDDTERLWQQALLHYNCQ